MADPKYANLPGIAHDQPDEYQVNPGDENNDEEYMHWDKPDPIELLRVSTNEAFIKFKGKNLDGSTVDFSDRIRNSKAKGYFAWSGDLDIVPGGGSEKETVIQKYQRLNCEIRELLDDIDVLKTKEKSEDTVGHLVGFARQTEQLQTQLNNLKLEETIGADFLKDLEDPRGAARTKLISQLESLKKSSLGKKLPSSSEDVDGSNVLYELLMKPEASKFEEQTRIAEIEQRIERLEKALGSAPNKMSALSLETNQKSVFAAIQFLTSRLSLLDPHHLDHIEGRLAALHQKVNAIDEKKMILEDAKKQSKIFELYDLMHQSESMAAALPEVVDRLEALQALHEQAFQFSKALAQLDAVQQKIETSLGNNQKVLTNTQAKFSENVERIQSNFENLEQRLSSLKK